jgi:hypothetical protein
MKTLYFPKDISTSSIFYIYCSVEDKAYCYDKNSCFLSITVYLSNVYFFDTFSIKIDRKLNQITYVDIMDYIKKHLPELML